MALVYQVALAISTAVAKTAFRLKVEHAERIPRDGGLILAMNHQSYLDPPLAAVAAREREIFFLARKTLMKWPVLGSLFPHLNVIPVDQERADMSALKTVIKQVRAGRSTVIFPEGSRTLDGQLQPAQPGLGLVVAKTLAPVVPMRIFGAYEAFPRGGKPRPHPIRIVVGEPMRWTEEQVAGSPREVYQRISDEVMARIAGM